MVDDNRADESCEVIEATRVEKATERTSEALLVVVGSPKTPPPIVSSKGQVETAPLEERSKRAAEDEDLVEAPVSKAARNAPTIASPIPKPRTKLGGKAVMASSSSSEDELGGKPEVGKGSSSQGESCGEGEKEGQDPTKSFQSYTLAGWMHPCCRGILFSFSCCVLVLLHQPVLPRRLT